MSNDNYTAYDLVLNVTDDVTDLEAKKLRLVETTNVNNVNFYPGQYIIVKNDDSGNVYFDPTTGHSLNDRIHLNPKQEIDIYVKDENQSFNYYLGLQTKPKDGDLCIIKEPIDESDKYLNHIFIYNDNPEDTNENEWCELTGNYTSSDVYFDKNINITNQSISTDDLYANFDIINTNNNKEELSEEERLALQHYGDKNIRSISYIYDPENYRAEFIADIIDNNSVSLELREIASRYNDMRGREPLFGDLIIPYECKIDGNLYKVTEFNCHIVQEQDNISRIVFPDTLKIMSFSVYNLYDEVHSYTMPDLYIQNTFEKFSSNTFENARYGNIYYNGSKDKYYNILINSLNAGNNDNLLNFNVKCLLNEDNLTKDEQLGLRYYDNIDARPTDQSLFTYELNEITYEATITGFNSNNITEITIPYEIINDGKFYKVTKIEPENLMFDSLPITKINIPNTIHIIPTYFCNNCKNLLKLILPNSITEIMHAPFTDMSEEFTIILPESITKLHPALCNTYVTVIYTHGFENYNAIDISDDTFSTADRYKLYVSFDDLDISYYDNNHLILTEEEQLSLQYYGNKNIKPSSNDLFEFSTFNNRNIISIKQNIELPETLVIPYEYKANNKTYIVNSVYFNSSFNNYYVKTLIIPNTIGSFEDDSRIFLQFPNLETIIISDSINEFSSGTFRTSDDQHTFDIYYHGNIYSWYELLYNSLLAGGNNNLLNANVHIQENSYNVNAFIGLKYYNNASKIPTDQSYFTYTVNNDKATITKFINKENNKISDVVIPYEIIDNNDYHYEVKYLSEHTFDNDSFINSITIPNTIHNIPMSFTENCDELHYLELSNSISYIMASAFSNPLSVIYFHGTQDEWDHLLAYSADSAFYHIDGTNVYNCTNAIPDYVRFTMFNNEFSDENDNKTNDKLMLFNTKGKTIGNLIELILNPYKIPDITQPNIKIDLAYKGKHLIGSTVSTDFIITFNKGSYEFDETTNVELNITDIIDSLGNHALNVHTEIDDDEKKVITGTFNDIVIPDNSDYEYKIKVVGYYSNGIIPKTSKGEDYPEGQITRKGINVWSNDEDEENVIKSDFPVVCYGCIDASEISNNVSSDIFDSLNKIGYSQFNDSFEFNVDINEGLVFFTIDSRYSTLFTTIYDKYLHKDVMEDASLVQLQFGSRTYDVYSWPIDDPNNTHVFKVLK